MGEDNSAEAKDFGGDDGGEKDVENPTVRKTDVGVQKSKKRKRKSGARLDGDGNDGDGCYFTELERFYERAVLYLAKPSSLLLLGSKNVRQENRGRLFRLLRKLVRRHNWREASGVLSVLLRGTCKDNCPSRNRTKFLVAMEVVKHIETGNVRSRSITGLYDTWMTRIGIDLSMKGRKIRNMKEDSFIVRLESILTHAKQGNIGGERQNARSLMQEPACESHPMYNLIIGLIFSQLWYSSIPGHMQHKDYDQLHSPTYSDVTTTSQSETSAVRFGCKAGDSEGHNSIGNDESNASFQHDSCTSVMKNKEIHMQADDNFQREEVPVRGDVNRESLLQDFKPQGFYANSAENDASADDDMHYAPNISALMRLDSWLLPLQPGNGELNKLIQDDDYENAVKYLRQAVESTTPLMSALLPLIQLLLIGYKDKEALNLLDKFCGISTAAFPSRVRASLLERLDPNNGAALSTCYEDSLKKDPTCSESLAKLISLNENGNYSAESLIEMIALHLDAVFPECEIWRQFALCFLKVFQHEEDHLSVCLDKNEGGGKQRYSVRYNRIPGLFTHGESGRDWKFRCRWWLTRHFSRSMLTLEIDAGDLQLLTYKAACASHMYSHQSEYVLNAYACLADKNSKDLFKFLKVHMQNSVGIYRNFQQNTS